MDSKEEDSKAVPTEMTRLSDWPGLDFVVEELQLRELQQTTLSGWTRRSTVVELSGTGFRGVGEDVTYEAGDHNMDVELLRKRCLGRHTWDEFSERVREMVSEQTLTRSESKDYRQWAFESAALDLALQQHGQSLSQLLKREAQPLSFVVSMSLGLPPSFERVHAWLAVQPQMRFKLDVAIGWNEAFCRALESTTPPGAIACIDLKGYYRGTEVDLPADADLYQRVVRCFPNAFIEDPWWSEETAPVLQSALDRLSWDAPIHSVADVLALPIRPNWLNCKPSRFGSLRRLFEFYDHCAGLDDQAPISLYGGGQFELGPGRIQAQRLAAHMHPHSANDLAPSEYNLAAARSGLSVSPLPASRDSHGFH